MYSVYSSRHTRRSPSVSILATKSAVVCARAPETKTPPARPAAAIVVSRRRMGSGARRHQRIALQARREFLQRGVARSLGLGAPRAQRLELGLGLGALDLVDREQALAVFHQRAQLRALGDPGLHALAVLRRQPAAFAAQAVAQAPRHLVGLGLELRLEH